MTSGLSNLESQCHSVQFIVFKLVYQLCDGAEPFVFYWRQTHRKRMRTPATREVVNNEVSEWTGVCPVHETDIQSPHPWPHAKKKYKEVIKRDILWCRIYFQCCQYGSAAKGRIVQRLFYLISVEWISEGLLLFAPHLHPPPSFFLFGQLPKLEMFFCYLPVFCNNSFLVHPFLQEAGIPFQYHLIISCNSETYYRLNQCLYWKR